MVTDFWCESVRIGVPHLHSVRWHSTTHMRRMSLKVNARVNTADDPSTFDKNLVNFGQVTLSFAGVFAPGGIHTGLCRAFL